jgi:hypothetical protein
MWVFAASGNNGGAGKTEIPRFAWDDKSIWGTANAEPA